MAFWRNFSPFSYVVIYLVKWRKVALKSHFHFCSSGKKAEKAIFWSEIQFFVNDAHFSVCNLLFFSKSLSFSAFCIQLSNIKCKGTSRIVSRVCCSPHLTCSPRQHICAPQKVSIIKQEIKIEMQIEIAFRNLHFQTLLFSIVCVP